jgi:hypothetical protein
LSSEAVKNGFQKIPGGREEEEEVNVFLIRLCDIAQKNN